MTSPAKQVNALGTAAGRGLRWWPALLVAFALSPAYAQPSVTLHIPPGDVYANEAFAIEIRIENYEQCLPPVLPDIPNCTIAQPPDRREHTQMSLVKGRMQQTRSLTYRYQLTARKPGPLVIPPITVTVDGRSFETLERRLTVRASDADELLSAEITCDRQRLYVGQQARFTLTVWVKPVRVGTRALRARTMLRYFSGSSFGPFSPRVDVGERRRTLPDGTSELYYTYETSVEHVVERAGPLLFDDVVIGMDYPTRFGRDFFDDLVVTGHRRLRVRPLADNIDVLPLPAQGRPAGFSGAVGTYTLYATAEPINARVGDPIELTINISGDGPLETLPAPTLSAQTELTEAFRVPADTPAGMLTGGRKRFTHIVRPKRPDVTEIPPIEYAYFDPEQEQYAIARSRPITIRVTAADVLDVADLTEITATPAGPASTGLAPLAGLRDNDTSETALLSDNQVVGMTHLATAALAPPAAFLLFWTGTTLARARSGDPVRRRRQAALRNAKQKLADARSLPPRELSAEIAATFAAYLADRTDQPPARFTARDALDFLSQRGVAPGLCQRCATLLERCELASYGGTADADADALTRETRDCLALLEKERL